MNTPYSLGPGLRKRNPFAPFDAQNAMPDDALYQPGPSLGPAGGPPPTPTPDVTQSQPLSSGSSLYTPAPTGPMPDFSGGDALQKANAALYAPRPANAPTSPPAPSRGDGILSGRPPTPKIYTANDPEVKASMGPIDRLDGAKRQAVANQMNAATIRLYDIESNRYQQEQQHELQAGYARNVGLTAPAESQLMALARPDSGAPPETQAWARGELEKMRKYNLPAETPFQIWQRQNPGKDISEWFKIQPAVQSTTIRAEMPPKEPTPSFSQADVKLKDGTSVPGSFNAHSGKYYDASGQEIPPDQIAGATRVGSANIFTPDDAKSIADAIEKGIQPPNVRGLYRNAAPVRAELAKRGYDLSHAEMDWDATKRFLATLNNPQQVRLRQAVAFARDSVPLIDGLYDHLNEIAPRSGFKIINKASIAAMKQLPGDAGATAQAIETQLNHLTGELGNIYMGGNSPTDMALRLGSNAIEKDWNIETWKKNIELLKKNLDIRMNSIATSAPLGVTPGSSYLPKGIVPQGAPGGAEAETPASVKADFKAGRITREQAKQKLEALGIK